MTSIPKKVVKNQYDLLRNIKVEFRPIGNNFVVDSRNKSIWFLDEHDEMVYGNKKQIFNKHIDAKTNSDLKIFETSSWRANTYNDKPDISNNLSLIQKRLESSQERKTQSRSTERDSQSYFVRYNNFLLSHYKFSRRVRKKQ